MSAPIRNMTFRLPVHNISFYERLLLKNARGYRRRPVRVVSTNEEVEKLERKGVNLKDPKHNPNVEYHSNDPVLNNMKMPNKSLSEAKQMKDKLTYQEMVSPKPKKQKQNNIEYIRIEEADMSKKFNQVLMNAKSKKGRETKNEIVLEGRRLIIDALKADATMKALYFSKTDVLDNFPADMIDCPVYKVPHRHLKVWSDTDTPQGILGLFERPKAGEILVPREKELPVTLICDKVTDPGNMGTLIRTAAAAGCNRFITMTGCVDSWDSKVLRSGAGGHFRIPIINSLSWEYLCNYVPSSLSVFITDSRRPSEWALDDIIRTNSNINADLESIYSENDDENAEIDDVQTKMKGDKSFSPENIDKYDTLPLNVSLYSEVDYTLLGHTLLIVGGETKGCSTQARKLAFDNYGQFVMLPMAKGINTLNPAITGSIVLYEIHKQYSEKVSSTESVEQI